MALLSDVQNQMQVVILLLACAWAVDCYSSGRVSASCAGMRPSHGVNNPMPEPAPYTLSADRYTYEEGDEITVTLKATATPFKGFMIQAQEVGGSSPVGTFSPIGSDSQLLACGGQPNTAVSHTSSVDKNTVQSRWKAPNSGSLKNIEFRATFVQTYRTYWVAVRSTQVLYNGSADPGSSLVSGAGCGISKICLSQPNSCDPAVSSDCYFTSAVLSSVDSSVRMEISGPSEGYVSLGFSDDKQMGNDDIYICGRDSNGLLQVQHAYSTGRRAPNILPLGNVSNIQTSDLNGVISCSFTSQNPISITGRTRSSASYFLMFASGPSSDGAIRRHTNRFVSDVEVDISSPQPVINSNLPSIVKAHGALMLISWMTTGSLGMIIARYFKGIAKGNQYCGKDFWFLAHVSLMSLSLAATSIAFILIFSHAQNWTGGAHPVLGCLVTILALLQPAAAVFRCGPQHKWRFLFNWSHAVNALVMKGLAVAAIFTGLALIEDSRVDWLRKVMGGFVVWEVLMFSLQDLLKQWKKNGAETIDSDAVSNEVILLIVFFLGNMAFLVALLVGIGST